LYVSDMNLANINFLKTRIWLSHLTGYVRRPKIHRLSQTVMLLRQICIEY
jgi:hypothetical protein